MDKTWYVVINENCKAVQISHWNELWKEKKNRKCWIKIKDPGDVNKFIFR